jgi:hypothetical protein
MARILGIMRKIDGRSTTASIALVSSAANEGA